MNDSLLQRIFNQFSTMGTDVKNLFATVGSLADLNTANRVSIVDAINEQAAKEVKWSSIKEVPTEFPPEDHDHDWNEINNVPTEFQPKAHKHDWSDIENSPALIKHAALFGSADDVVVDGVYPVSSAPSLPDGYPAEKEGVLTVYSVGELIFQQYWTVENVLFRRVKNITWSNWE